MRTEPLCQICGVPESFHGLPPTDALCYPQHTFEPPAHAIPAGQDLPVSAIPQEMPHALRYMMEEHLSKTGAGNLEHRGTDAAMRGAFMSGAIAILSIVIAKERDALTQTLAWWRSGLEAAGASSMLAALDAFTKEEM